MEKKKCYMCNEEKDLELFCKSKKAKNGITNLCKSCHYTNRKEKYYESEKLNRKKVYDNMKANPEKYAKYLQTKRQFRAKNKEMYMFFKARNRSTYENIPFNIEISDIIIPKLCPILEVELNLNEGENTFYSPSLDKINPKLGYIKNNIRVISKKANMMKLNASLEELELFSKNIINYMKC